MTSDRPATRKTAARKTTSAEPADDSSPAGISTHQMRQLHALLRDHGITGDKAVHDYLTVALGRPISSRTEVTTVEAARLIVDLEAAPVTRTTGAGSLADLRAAFPEEAIGKLPRSTCKDCSDNRGTCSRHPQKFKCGICGNYHSDSSIHLDFVGHADVTARLLEVDPEWTWRPFTAEEMSALPPVLRDAGLWIHLTVLGVTRPGFGDADGKRGGNAVKECIGDALRNAAMRFGVALDLWAKGDRDWTHAEKDSGGEDLPPGAPTPRQDGPPQEAPYHGPSTAELLEMIASHADRAGTTLEAMTAKWRTQHAGLTPGDGPVAVEELGTLPPQAVAPLEAAISEYLRQNPPGELTGDRDV